MSVPPTLERHPGFLLVRISGSPAELGLQHGLLLRDQIRGLRAALYREVIFYRGRAAGVALQAVMLPLVLMFHRHIPPELRWELRGVARGAGVRYWDVLLLNCFDDLLHALWLIPPLVTRLPVIGRRLVPGPTLACSSFAVTRRRSGAGELLHARNLDYEVDNSVIAAEGAVPRALRENVVVFECHPRRGNAFLSVGWPGVIGVVTGITDAGLSLACLTSTVRGETPNGLPLPLLYRQIAQYAATLDEAEAMVRGAPITIGNNLVLASATEDEVRVLELSPHGVTRRSPRAGVVVATNHFVHPDQAAHQDGWVIPNSLDRYARLERLCTDGTPVDCAVATRFLRDTLSLAPDGNPWSCLQNPGTIYSTVAAPASGRLWLRVNDAPHREFVPLTASWARRADVWRP